MTFRELGCHSSREVRLNKGCRGSEVALLVPWVASHLRTIIAVLGCPSSDTHTWRNSLSAPLHSLLFPLSPPVPSPFSLSYFTSLSPVCPAFNSHWPPFSPSSFFPLSLTSPCTSLSHVCHLLCFPPWPPNLSSSSHLVILSQESPPGHTSHLSLLSSGHMHSRADNTVACIGVHFPS